MTQKELEDKLREIKIIYGDRSRDLIAAHQPKITEIEGEIETAKTEHDQKVIDLHEEYQKLNTQEVEFRRQGLTHLSAEVDNIRRQKDDNKNRTRRLHLAFNQKMHELKIRLSAAKIELNTALGNNAQLRNKAKREVCEKLNK